MMTKRLLSFNQLLQLALFSKNTLTLIGIIVFYFTHIFTLSAQIQNGCVNANFGVDADVYANKFQFGGFTTPSGKDDWFKSTAYSGSGVGVLDTTGAAFLYSFYSNTANRNQIFIRRASKAFFEQVNNNIQVDALFARDYYGAAGYEDSTAFATGSKNGDDPLNWGSTFMPVQGKNDIIDVYGHLRRAGTTSTSPLWLFMGASIVGTSGTRYMDFEFFQKSLTFKSGTGFTSSGTEEGHTAFNFDKPTGKITKAGDLIFNTSVNGSSPSYFEIRIWVSRALFNDLSFNPANFDFDRSGGYFDGASNGSTYGYAKIIPKGGASLQACGIVNTASTLAGAWGTIDASGNHSANYSNEQFSEFGFNLSSFGIDPLAINPLASPCTAAFATYVVKTRASASFTAALKDFGGPYVFGGPQSIAASIVGSNILTCYNTSATLTATILPASSAAYYSWTLPDGTTQSGTNLNTIVTTHGGTYTLALSPAEGCSATGNTTFILNEDKTTPPVPTNPQGASYCIGNSPLPISVTNPAAGYLIRWYNVATGGSILSTEASYTPTAAGTYYVEMRNTTNGCLSARIPVTLTQVTTPSVSVTPSATNVCIGGSATITADITGGTAPFSYQWQSSTDSVVWTNISCIAATYDLVTTSSSNFYYRVVVISGNAACSAVASKGVRITVANTPGCDCLLQSCAAYTKLVFINPTQVSNPTGLVGDKWRFDNVATDYDAFVEITNAVNVNSLNTIDHATINVNDWCPEINLNYLAGQDSYIDWKITIVAHGTTTPANLPSSSRVTSYDVDGNSNYREIHGHINSNGYILNNPTELAISKEGQYSIILGSTTEHNSISTDAEVKSTFYYPGQNNIFTIRLGARTTHAVASGYRQFAVSFDPCISYTNPNITPQSPEIAGIDIICVGGTNPTYTTTQPFTSYTWSVTGGSIISGQNSRTITVDWTSIGLKNVIVETIDANGCMKSDTFQVKIVAKPSVNISVSVSAICIGGNAVLTANMTDDSNTCGLQWQSSLNNINWTNIAGETRNIYTISALNNTTRYRVVLNCSGSGCCN